MTRLARRASLLVAFYLLISTATAHAECAWVLWEENPPNNWRLSSTPHFTVFDKQIVCTNATTQLFNARYQFNLDAKREGRKELPVPNFVCLPDAVDPRGPKRK